MRRNPMDAASIQPCWSRSSHLEKHGRQILSISCSKSSSRSTGLQASQCKRQERKRKKLGKEIGNHEKTPNERHESDGVDFNVDPDRCQDANGGSGGAGNLSTPRNGAGARHLSHPASKRKAGQDGRGGTPVKEDGEQGEFGTRNQVKTARERTQGPVKKTAREGTQAPVKKTARERTQAPLRAKAIRRRGSEFRKSKRKRSGRRRRKRKRRKW